MGAPSLDIETGDTKSVTLGAPIDYQGRLQLGALMLYHDVHGLTKCTGDVGLNQGPQIQYWVHQDSGEYTLRLIMVHYSSTKVP